MMRNHQTSAALLFVLLAIAQAYPTTDPARGVWKHPGVGDVRGPCPMLNTLANHGYLPRNGMNITLTQFTSTFESVLNIGAALAYAITSQAFVSFETLHLSLDTLDTHNVIEHDASMTRLDAALGDNHDLNPALFKRLLNASSDGQVLTTDDFGQYQKIRQAESQANNPSYTFGLKQQTAASLEPSIILAVLGNQTSGDNTAWAVSLDAIMSVFGQEQLPEGFVAPSETIGFTTLLPIAGRIKENWDN